MAESGEPAAFVLGTNATTLAFVSSLRDEGGLVEAHLVPLAWTPAGVVCGANRRRAKIPANGVLQWMDQTFPPEDEHAFVASPRDLELLVRTDWNASVPDRLDERSVVNLDDLPEEIADALMHDAAVVVACATCRRLCVKDEFAWKERQLCAWDYHAAVFGKRGPWRNGAYEERLFATLPQPAYVAPPLLEELRVEVVLATAALDDAVAQRLVNDVLDSDARRAHIAVRTPEGYTVLRERTT